MMCRLSNDVQRVRGKTRTSFRAGPVPPLPLSEKASTEQKNRKGDWPPVFSDNSSFYCTLGDGERL
jgi:hypothetical protein